MAVPALWPATQLHYTVLALPVLSPALAVFAAVNHPGFMGLGVMCYALWTRRDEVDHMFARRTWPFHRLADRKPPS